MGKLDLHQSNRPPTGYCDSTEFHALFTAASAIEQSPFDSRVAAFVEDDRHCNPGLQRSLSVTLNI
jgi:hypothetical protein